MKEGEGTENSVVIVPGKGWWELGGGGQSEGIKRRFCWGDKHTMQCAHDVLLS